MYRGQHRGQVYLKCLLLSEDAFVKSANHQKFCLQGNSTRESDADFKQTAETEAQESVVD